MNRSPAISGFEVLILAAVSILPRAAHAQDAYEPDNSASAAQTIPYSVVQNRSIHAAGDVDWARFYVDPPGARNLQVASSFDTQIWLYRGSGAWVGYDSADGLGDDSVIEVAEASAGMYYIKIQEYGNDGIEAGYQLWVSWDPAPDSYESDNVASAARGIGNRRDQFRSIHAIGDVDWAKFVVGSGGAQNLRISVPGGMQMWLYRGGNGQLLGYAEGSGPGDVARIHVDALTAGTYLIKIRDYGNDETIPSYLLRAEWDLPPDAFEPDNAASAAKWIVNGHAQIHSIHRVGDVDWMKFAVGSAGARNFSLQGVPGMTMELRNGVGRLIAEDHSHWNWTTYSPRLTAATLTPGTYFIRTEKHGRDGVIAPYALRANWTSP